MMRDIRFKQPLILSIAFHACLFVLMLVVSRHMVTKDHRSFLVVLEKPGPSRPARHGLGKSPGKTGRKAKPLDLRPGFVRNGIFAQRAPSLPSENASSGSSDSADLMKGDLKAADLFDRLADKVGVALDYPDVLIEQGVEGTASIDLYFDSRGMIDEGRSIVSGDRGSLRGAMVRAMRSGLVSWYKSDAVQLRKDEFRNQHFRADFTLSYTLSSDERNERVGLGSYHFLRQKHVSVCLYPGAIDLACAAMKVAGFVKKHTSDKYNVHAAAVVEVLESFDSEGLQGINAEIQKNNA